MVLLNIALFDVYVVSDIDKLYRQHGLSFELLCTKMCKLLMKTETFLKQRKLAFSEKSAILAFLHKRRN